MEAGGDHLHKVWEIRTLKSKPDEPHARALLERIARQVQPIMRRRKWRVRLLSEFSSARLLGLNVGRGAEVKLALRRPGHDHAFLPFEEVLDTMLHELCHIVRGPHDAQFYKLWDELRKECEELVSKGIIGTGQGFDGIGRRLGGCSRQLPPHSLRQATLAAAQKRARNGALLPSGPRKLGGSTDIMAVLSPIQAAAMAAERRMYDDLWCGSRDQSGVDSSDDLLDVTVLTEPSNLTTKDKKLARRDVAGKDKAKVRKITTSDSSNTFAESSSAAESAYYGSSLHWATSNANDGPLWECAICTLLNKPLAPICEACGVAKPEVAQTELTTWSCRFCTLNNSTNIDKCLACYQWRNS